MKVVIGERFGHVVHRVEHPQLFAKHEQLDQRIRRLLAAERGDVFGLGLAMLAVTGKAGRRAFLHGFGRKRRRGERERQE